MIIFRNGCHKIGYVFLMRFAVVEMQETKHLTIYIQNTSPLWLVNKHIPFFFKEIYTFY